MYYFREAESVDVDERILSTIEGCSRPPQHESSESVLVSVVMPCLNEARTVGSCVERAHEGCMAAVQAFITARESLKPLIINGNRYEVIVADNGSTDGSQQIAESLGARVVAVKQKGYGAALLGGLAAARGRYVVMGDSDLSYDFGEIPQFIDKLREGYDLVIGNRFAGGIMPGAMPWHHKYIGNPVLSGIGRLLFPTRCQDWHCGLRGLDLLALKQMDLKCMGMEFASEMIIKAIQQGLRCTEIPVMLRPDGRDRPPHLRSLRDGWRHLSLMFRSFSKWRVA